MQLHDVRTLKITKAVADRPSAALAEPITSGLKPAVFCCCSDCYLAKKTVSYVATAALSAGEQWQSCCTSTIKCWGKTPTNVGKGSVDRSGQKKMKDTNEEPLDVVAVTVVMTRESPVYLLCR